MFKFERFLAVLIVLGSVHSAAAATNWLSAEAGAIPSDAIGFGRESNGTTLYPCRAWYAGGQHPGKAAPHLRACNISYGGQEIAIPSYQVAVSAWTPAANGAIPADAVVTYESGMPRYICRASHNGGVVPGKIGPGFAGCKITQDVTEITKTSYSVLVLGEGLSYTMSNADYSWGVVPNDAVVGGQEMSQRSYVCFANHNGGWVLGKVRPNQIGCAVHVDGQLQWKNSYRVLQPASLAGVSAAWRFAAGYEPGHTMYSCRALHSGGTHPGKTWQGLNGCLIPYGGQEIFKPAYTLLGD